MAQMGFFYGFARTESSFFEIRQRKTRDEGAVAGDRTLSH